jgi:hypothetical protein
LERDRRASVLIAEGGSLDPLANARAAFFAAHPNSAYYDGFRDFAFWKLDVSSVRYIGGMGDVVD